jgi:putative thioredoxin
MTESPYVFEVNEASFQERVLDASRQVPVLVDFWAAWCAPCRMLVPILARLADDYRGKVLVAKVNTDVEQGLAMRYGVRSLPTVKLFVDGQAVDEFLGALPEGAVREFVGRYVERDSDRTRAHALDLHDRGRSTEAEGLLRRVMAEDPENLRAPLDLVQVLGDTGKFEEAEAVLASLPANRQMDAEVVALTARVGFARAASESPDPGALERRLAAAPEDSEARYRLACHRILAGDYEQALELLYDLLLRDRRYGDDAARKAMLSVFETLGGQGPLVSRYRGLLSRALY